VPLRPPLTLLPPLWLVPLRVLLTLPLLPPRRLLTLSLPPSRSKLMVAHFASRRSRPQEKAARWAAFLLGLRLRPRVYFSSSTRRLTMA
jgi:hypothetical protein